MTKRVLFLYSNRPDPLVSRMMHLVGSTGDHRAEMLYYDRGDSPVSSPLLGLIGQDQCSAIAWPVGNHALSKAANRAIVLAKFVREIRARKPDVVHAWNLDMLLAARIAALRMKGTTLVFTLQDTTQWMLSPIAKALQRWAYRGVELIFVMSDAFESRFLRRFDLIAPEKKVVFVPNVPPAPEFAHFEPRVPGLALTVGYVGFFRGMEAITTLFEATRRAREQGADVRLLFAGKGLEGDLVARLAKENTFVDYLGPYRYDQEILGIYGKADVLYGVYDRSYDKQIHLAYRLCEAVNCRLPIIVARGTHMAEVVETHGLGVSVGFGDVDELAEALVMLSQSPGKRMQIAANCEKTRPEFVLEHYQERICAAYRELRGQPTRMRTVEMP